MSWNLLIRADCSREIGSGHALRCFALAAEWKERGGDVTFVGHCDGESIRRRFARSGITMEALQESPGSRADLDHTLREASRLGQPWVVVDGYAFDADYLAAIRVAGYRLLVVDDQAALVHYDADMVLNHNVGAESLDYRAPSGTTLRLGPRYALLRREFLTERAPAPDAVPRVARRLLVTLGGADGGDVLSVIAPALRDAQVAELEVLVVLGPINPRGSEIRRTLQEGGATVRIVTSTDDMASLMAWSEMAVSAAGSTILELAYMGVPALLVVVAENQARGGEAMARSGAAVVIGRSSSIKEKSLAKLITALAHDHEWRRAAAKAGRGLVDGRGADRVIGALAPGRPGHVWSEAVGKRES